MMKNAMASILNTELDNQYLSNNINSDYEAIRKFIPFFTTPNIHLAYSNRHRYQFPLENFESLLRKVDSIQNLDIGLQEDLESYWMVSFS